MDLNLLSQADLFKKATGLSRGLVRGFAVALVIISLVLLVAAVVTSLSGDWSGLDLSSSGLPNARKIVGEEGKWAATGTALVASLVVGGIAFMVGKMTGGQLGVDDANLATNLLQD